MSNNVKSSEGFKELRIEPVQSDKLKEHAKKKSSGGKKKHHKHKDAFAKNKTSFLDEEPGVEEKQPKNQNSSSNNQEFKSNESPNNSLLNKPPEKSMMKLKSKEIKNFVEDSLAPLAHEKKEASKADARASKSGINELSPELKPAENKPQMNGNSEGSLIKKEESKAKEEGAEAKKKAEKEENKESEKGKKEAKESKNEPKEKKAEKNEKKGKKEKKEEKKAKESKNEKNDKISKTEKNDNDEKNDKHDEKNAKKEKNDKSEKNAKSEKNDKNEKIDKKEKKAKKTENEDNGDVPFLNKEKEKKSEPEKKTKAKEKPLEVKSEKPPLKKVSSQFVIKKLINKEECEQIFSTNILKSQRHFFLMKLAFTAWTLPVLILNLIESHRQFQDAHLPADITKYKSLKVYAFLGMIVLVALIIFDLLLYSFIKGKTSKILIQTIFVLNFLVSLGLILGYFSFYLWQIWYSKVSFFFDIYIQMLSVFVLMAVTAIRFTKLQIFSSVLLLYYVIFLLIYLKYYHKIAIDDAYTLIKVGEIFTFLITASLLTNRDPFEIFKPVYEEENRVGTHNSKPLSSILIKEKKTFEDPNMMVIEMDGLPHRPNHGSIEGVLIEKAAESNMNVLKTVENIKKPQSMSSFTDLDGDSKKWLRVFNNFPKGVIILDRTFQILYSNRKINRYVGVAENEKDSSFFQAGFESLLPAENTQVSSIEFSQALELFIPTVTEDISLKKVANKHLETLDIHELFSDLKYILLEGLNSRTSGFYQALKQNSLCLKYSLNQRVVELVFYSVDIKGENKDYLAFFFGDGENALNKGVDQKKGRVNSGAANVLLRVGGELRGPITVVIEMLEKMRENFWKTPNIVSFLEPAYQNSYLLFTYVNGLLDLSRLNLGTFKLSMMEYDLKILLDHLISILRPQASRKGLELSYLMAKKLPRIIFTDPLRLMQVLFILLRNSLRTSEKGTIRLSVTEYYIENELFFQFEVRDSSEILFCPKTIALFSPACEEEIPSLEFSLLKRLVKELGVQDRNSLLISGSKSGNSFKFLVSNRRNVTTLDFDENLEDGMLESNYIEKKNRNVEVYKETICSDKDSKSSVMQGSPLKESNLATFAMFKAAMNNRYCFCPVILLAFQDFHSLLSLQHILLNLGFLSEFCPSFPKALIKVKERAANPPCGKHCHKYSLLMIDGDRISSGDKAEETISTVAFFDDEGKGREISKKAGIDEVLGKGFNEEEVRSILEKYFWKKGEGMI